MVSQWYLHTGSTVEPPPPAQYWGGGGLQTDLVKSPSKQPMLTCLKILRMNRGTIRGVVRKMLGRSDPMFVSKTTESVTNVRMERNPQDSTPSLPFNGHGFNTRINTKVFNIPFLCFLWSKED